MDWTAIWLTFQLATATTFALCVIGLPLGYWLGTTRHPFRHAIEAIVALPLVLPPTVLGFYLLILLGPQSWIGLLVNSQFGIRIPFTFGGILLGSILFNLPFAVRPFASAFATFDWKLTEAAWCLGVSRWETFRRIVVPLCWPGILAGVVLTFSHTVGEFGVVLMLGGNIVGKTRTVSVSIYDSVQSLDYDTAARTSFGLILFSFLSLILIQLMTKRGLTR